MTTAGRPCLRFDTGRRPVRLTLRLAVYPWCLALYAGFGWSQVTTPTTPSVLPTPAQLAPRPTAVSTDPRELPARPAPPRELAKPTDDLTLDVRRYELSDNAPPELKSALAALTAPYVGTQRSYEDLVNATAEVTRFLQRESGYYLGYAYLPEQAAQDGVVRIEVLEGRLDQVKLVWTDGLPVRREIVQAYLDRLKPGDILRVRELERVVFLVNDLRGLSSRFEVTAGSEPGTATLVVTPQAERRRSSKADVDINGSPYLGQLRLGGLTSVNSLAGMGDALTGNLLVSQGLQFALLGANLPLNASGLKLGGSLSLVRYRLDANQFPLGVNGDALTLSVYALYPWLRSRNFNLFSLVSLDDKRYADRFDAAGSQTDKATRVLTLGLSGDSRDNLFGGAVSTFEANLATGQVRYPGGIPSGLDDSPNFSKVTLGLNRLQNLVEGRWLLYAALRLQVAMANLDTSEQFRLGGPDGVRAFAAGEGTGDSGVVLTLELRMLPPESLVGRLAHESIISVFYDEGQVNFRHDPSKRPSSFVKSATFGGAGVAVSWERTGGYALRASLATPVHGQAKSDKVRSARLYAQLTKFF